jgi:hypothetical protein
MTDFDQQPITVTLTWGETLTVQTREASIAAGPARAGADRPAVRTIDPDQSILGTINILVA